MKRVSLYYFPAGFGGLFVNKTDNNSSSSSKRKTEQTATSSSSEKIKERKSKNKRKWEQLRKDFNDAAIIMPSSTTL